MGQFYYKIGQFQNYKIGQDNYKVGQKLQWQIKLQINTYKTDFDDFTVTYTDKSDRLLEIEDKVYLRLLLNK